MPRLARSNERIAPAGPPPTTQQDVWLMGEATNVGDGEEEMVVFMEVAASRTETSERPAETD